MKKACLYVFIIILAGCNAPETLETMIDELKEVDIAFSDMSREMGMNKAFTSFCASDAVLLRNNAMPIKGASSIAETLSLNDDKNYTLTWEPLHATVAKSGELGYTYGIFQLKQRESGEISRGTYVSIWVKENGAWKWVLDSGNEGLGTEDPGSTDSGV